MNIEYGVEVNSMGHVTFQPMPNLLAANLIANRGQIDGILSKRVMKREVGKWTTMS